MRGLDNFPDLMPEDKRWNFGWRAVRQVVCLYVYRESPKSLSRCSFCLSRSPVCVCVCVCVCVAHISCREAADYALVIVGFTALSCDPNVLRLIAGESTPRECLIGMAADCKVKRSPLN